MSHPRAPDLDPYFSPEGQGGKKWAASDEGLRSDLLSTEAAYRVAGTTAMILGTFIFIVFAIPVSSMLRHGDEPYGILLNEEWIWSRWVARMVTCMTVAILGSVLGWGLRGRHPWARRAMIAVGGIPPLALLGGLALRALATDPSTRQLADVATIFSACVFILPASLAVCWMALSRRARAVFAPDYKDLIARTPKLVSWRGLGRMRGLGLALALFILLWALMHLFLSFLVVLGKIRTA